MFRNVFCPEFHPTCNQPDIKSLSLKCIGQSEFQFLLLSRPSQPSLHLKNQISHFLLSRQLGVSAVHSLEVGMSKDCNYHDLLGISSSLQSDNQTLTASSLDIVIYIGQTARLWMFLGIIQIIKQDMVFLGIF